jgi:hypothetical protein
MFSDTFAGISPASVLPCVVFQIIGAALGTVRCRVGAEPAWSSGSGS